MPTFKDKIKQYYGIDEEAFLEKIKAPSFSSMPDISSFECVKKAISELKKCKKENKKIIVYGDYDFDGISATTIIYSLLKRDSYNVSFYTPSRYLDGYGLNEANVIRIAKAGFSLIFTVDNGVTSFEAIKKANEFGVKIIILDHHEYQEAPNPILSLIHPNTVGLANPSISAGFLSYLFLRAYLHADDEYLFCLGATSLLSDAMPLLSYNRDAANLALCLLNEKKFSSFCLLTDKNHFYSSTLQMDIIPKINAIGRVETGTETNRVVRYFASNDEKEKNKLAAYFSEVNQKRKALTKNAEGKIIIEDNKASIFLITDLPEGLNGLLANRLLNEYEKPVAVFSASKKDSSIFVGSIRSKEGFNVLKALNGSKVKLVAFGGHAFAGGVSINKEDLSVFKTEFEYAALKHKFDKIERKAIPLEPDECSIENLTLLQALGPFGNENPAPLFAITKEKSEITFTINGFLSMKINNDARLFSFTLKDKSIPTSDQITFLCSMEPNEWKGKVSLQLLAQEIKTSNE